MKERPILFSTEMVLAILAGTKTQTRRICKIQPPSNYQLMRQIDPPYKYFFGFYQNNLLQDRTEYFNAYGCIGDILWVRETWAEPHYWTDNIDSEEYVYKINSHDPIKQVKWKPSIHMPKQACRIKLRITSIRIERLLDISEQDAIAEGIRQKFGGFVNYINPSNILTESYHYLSRKYSAAQISYFSLWESINGEDSLNKNPWVWVIEFERIL